MPERQGGMAAYLDRASPAVVNLYAMTAAFLAYFCMYAFRKPFTAGEFAGTAVLPLGFELPYKSLLVISQVLGYACSKFIGVRLISETRRDRRAVTIVACIVIAIGLSGTKNFPWA